MPPSASSLAVHPTAVVDPRAELADGVTVGPYAVIGPHVTVGARTVVGDHVLLDGWTTIGEDCRLFHGAVVGTPPQDLKFRDGMRSRVVLGDRTVVREFASVNRATGEDEATAVGSDVYLMMYAHVAHNCVLGDHVILANGVELAGCVTLEEWASVGGVSAIHQFARIGRHAFVGGMSRVVQDVPPYLRAAGNPLVVAGINAVGLERRGLPAETVRAIKHAYRTLYRSGLNTAQALARLRAECAGEPAVEEMVRFVEASTRGITRGRASSAVDGAARNGGGAA